MVATFSRTSCAAASMSRSRMNETKIWLWPSIVVERSSSMPLMVLTTSSIRLVIWLSTSSGLAPGSRVVIGHRRDVDLREDVEAEVAVGGEPEDHQRDDEHRREDGPADAEVDERHGASGLRGRRGRRGAGWTGAPS